MLFHIQLISTGGFADSASTVFLIITSILHPITYNVFTTIIKLNHDGIVENLICLESFDCHWSIFHVKNSKGKHVSNVDTK